MKLLGLGYALGKKKIPVKELFSDSRLVDKTGIEHVYEEPESLSELVLRAAEDIGHFDPATIKMCILVTQSPDDFLPANSIPLASKLCLPKDIIAFDINQGCSGFVQALCLLNNLTKRYSDALLITADRYRSKLGSNDRSTNAVFSDGASLSIWRADTNYEVFYESHLTDGSKRNLLYHNVDDAASGIPLHMSGTEVWMFTKLKVVPEIIRAIDFCRKEKLEIKKVYLHQASKVVIDGILNSLPLSVQENIPINYGRYGNTVSSTIPILLKDYPFKLKPKEVVLFCGFGVGLSASIAVYGVKHE